MTGIRTTLNGWGFAPEEFCLRSDLDTLRLECPRCSHPSSLEDPFLLAPSDFAPGCQALRQSNFEELHYLAQVLLNADELPVRPIRHVITFTPRHLAGLSDRVGAGTSLPLAERLEERVMSVLKSRRDEVRESFLFELGRSWPDNQEAAYARVGGILALRRAEMRTLRTLFPEPSCAVFELPLDLVADLSERPQFGGVSLFIGDLYFKEVVKAPGDLTPAAFSTFSALAREMPLAAALAAACALESY